MNGTNEINFSLKVIIFSQKVCLISYKCKDSKEASLKKNLVPGDVVHYILYVISADSSLSTNISQSLKEMKNILQRKHKDGNFFFSLKYPRHLTCSILGP